MSFTSVRLAISARIVLLSSIAARHGPQPIPQKSNTRYRPGYFALNERIKSAAALFGSGVADSVCAIAFAIYCSAFWRIYGLVKCARWCGIRLSSTGTSARNLCFALSGMCFCAKKCGTTIFFCSRQMSTACCIFLYPHICTISEDWLPVSSPKITQVLSAAFSKFFSFIITPKLYRLAGLEY